MKNLVLLGILVLALSVRPSFAEEADRSTAQFFDSVMSPYCPGMTLSACPSDDARILRDEIRAKLTKGVSRGEIQADLKSRFGNLTGEPASNATSSVAYTGILVFFAIGIGIIVLNVRKSEKGRDVQTEA